MPALAPHHPTNHPPFPAKVLSGRAAEEERGAAEQWLPQRAASEAGLHETEEADLPPCLPACLTAGWLPGCQRPGSSPATPLKPPPPTRCQRQRVTGATAGNFPFRFRLIAFLLPRRSRMEETLGDLGGWGGGAEVRAGREKVVVFCLAVLVPLT